MVLQALRVSMEEQRQRQEEEAKETTEASKESKPQTAVVADSAYDEDAVLRSALNMSMAGVSIIVRICFDTGDYVLPILTGGGGLVVELLLERQCEMNWTKYPRFKDIFAIP